MAFKDNGLGSQCVGLPGEIVWTTIIERGGYPVDISDSSVMIRPVLFFYSIAIILNMIFKNEMLFLQSIEAS